MHATYPAAVLVVLASASAHAQSLPDGPETVVVTATRLPTAADTIPAGVTVIDRATIEQRGYTDLVEALSAVPGLRVAQAGGPGSQASVFIRGANSNQVLVLRDGVPINDPGDPGGAFNFGDDTLGDIERIEVVRGPLSSLYGSGAIGGVINLITRRVQGPLHGDVTLAGGVPRQALFAGHAAGTVGIWDFATAAEGTSQLGFDQTPKREAAVYTGERDGERSRLGSLEIGATPMDGTRVSLLLRGRDATYGYDDQGQVNTYDAGNATGHDASFYGRLGITSRLVGGVWDTSLFLSGLQDDRHYTVTLSPADPNQDVSDDRYQGRRADLQWNNTVHLPDWRLFSASAITAGYEHVADQARTSITSVGSGFPFDNRVAAHADSDAGTLGITTTVFRRLILTAQGREDATTIAGDAATWRAGAVLDVPEIASHLKASYGTGFRAPALFDRYGVDSSGYIGNPNLRPERSAGWEAGITTTLFQDLLSVSATYFDNRFGDLIQLQFAPVYTSVNLASARAHGVEASVTVQAKPWLQADLSYTYTDARKLDAGARLLRRPYNQASADLRLAPVPGVTIAPELLYVGSFADVLTGDNGAYSGVGVSPSGLIFNLNATWQATPNVQVFVWGKNLGNSTFEPVNGYRAPGASFLAGSKISF